MRDTTSIGAQGCASITACADVARARIAVFQSSPGVGSVISPMIRSTIPSRTSSLLAT